jgi:hypothetical protein
MFVGVERHQPADGRNVVERVQIEAMMFTERHHPSIIEFETSAP